MTTTPGTYRHLGRAATADGHFVVLAIDHRRNLWDALQTHSASPLTDADFAAFKAAVIDGLADTASAVLTDPGYGLPAGGLAVRGGLLCPLEVTDYSLHPSARAFRPIPGWDVHSIKRVGADGVKLLLYYHPEADNAAEQRAVVQSVAADCARWELPLYLEPIAFSPDAAHPLSAAEHRQVVIETARLFCGMGIGVLKAEFPVDVKQVTDEAAWVEACRELDAACTVPWTLLSAGVSYETFRRQTEIACMAGASGVIVGRAVWNEAVALPHDERRAFFATTGRARMTELAAIVAAHGRGWPHRVSPPALLPEWYMRYAGE